ncbi:rhomboid family intramembrane serine protease [Paenibacillus sp. GP183]|uniref:rhomboid family intramembrane serine protease n=1 Tax=Paenibacillus sp. GP183 TaxID=1882751 RepID=UPI000894E6BD|nr:rhomboid family intramembrane serine protease [Paenibacillus sp. GP183]SEB53359.1 Membrane associated serine protease, rhomboid family [Paenibacillus sp. GP183]
MFARRESLNEYIQKYPVTFSMIVIQLLVMAAMEWYGSSQDSTTLLRFGAMFNLPDMHPEPWRYVTSIFIHIGWEHLLFNSFAMYVFAAPLERMLGLARYFLFYIACGIIGNLVSAQLHSGIYIGAGASGAIYGVYGAYLYLSIFRKDMIEFETRQTVIPIIVIGFIYSIVAPHVDIYAHLGGFLGGLALTALMTLFIERKHKEFSEDQLSEES